MRPASFHGHGREPPFFEGWYLKLIDRAQSRPIAIIPGVYFASDPSQSHAFVQVFDGARQRAWLARYEVDEFWAHDRDCEARIGPNRLRLGEPDGQLELDIDLPDLRLTGAVTMQGLQGWPVRWWSPGVMGFFGWIPILECYHGVIGFDHALDGELTLDGESVDFQGGRGYVEKDWGMSFPSSWIWCQSNHFGGPDEDPARVCLSASIAEIPNLGRTFVGFIVGLWIDGTLHAFTTHHLSRVEELACTEQRVRWVMSNRRHRLELEIHRAPPTILPGPTIEGMVRDVHETLMAEVSVRLSERGSGREVYRGTGRRAGLEIQGDIPHLARVARGRKQ